MAFFSYRNRQLHAEAVAVANIAARFGTPCYVYSRAALTEAYHQLDSAFDRPHLICYAVKANSNLAILNLFARLGSGFDVVSGGELQRVIAAGGDPGKTVFSGVGKSSNEIRFALDAGILCFNVESEGELRRLDRVAGDDGKRARVSLRVNPDVDPKTHPYIATGLRQNKFGIAYGDALRLYRLAAASAHLQVDGIDCHIGSQLTEVAPFVAALEKVLALVDRLEAEGIAIAHLDVGGGLGIRYRDERPPSIAEYAGALAEGLGQRAQKILLEPGRVLIGNAGALITRVEYLKHAADRNFAIVDAGMNDLLRPALYDAWHEIVKVEQSGGIARSYDVVGPVCESADFLGRGRELAIAEGDLLAVMSAGAYGASMSSNYNSRPRPPEVLVDGDALHLVRPRESFDDLTAGENLLP